MTGHEKILVVGKEAYKVSFNITIIPKVLLRLHCHANREMVFYPVGLYKLLPSHRHGTPIAYGSTTVGVEITDLIDAGGQNLQETAQIKVDLVLESTINTITESPRSRFCRRFRLDGEKKFRCKVASLMLIPRFQVHSFTMPSSRVGRPQEASGHSEKFLGILSASRAIASLKVRQWEFTFKKAKPAIARSVRLAVV